MHFTTVLRYTNTFLESAPKEEETIAYVEPISPPAPEPIVESTPPVIESSLPPQPVSLPVIPPVTEQAPVVPTPIVPPAEPVHVAPVVPIAPVQQNTPEPEMKPVQNYNAPVQPVIPSGNLSAFKQEPTAASFFNTPSNASVHSNDGY